jgi:hypothetical protein
MDGAAARASKRPTGHVSAYGTKFNEIKVDNARERPGLGFAKSQSNPTNEGPLDADWALPESELRNRYGVNGIVVTRRTVSH